MKIKNIVALLFVLSASIGTQSQEKKYIVHTIAFYNCENLFDTINDANNDEEYLPQKAGQPQNTIKN